MARPSETGARSRHETLLAALLWLLLLVSVLAAAEQQSESGSRDSRAEVETKRNAVPPAGEKISCAPIPGVASLLEHDVVLVGELHGTVEAPAFLGELGCHGLVAGLSVMIALEIVGAEAARFSDYLGSAGTAEDRRALLAGEPWQSRYQYGATSRAMLDLVERVRVLKQRGYPVGIFLFNRIDGRSSQERDRLMAETLARQIDSTLADVVMVLTGNIHSRLVRSTGFDPGYEPMGYLMRQAHPDWDLVSIDLDHEGGTAWLCTGNRPDDCGERKQSSRSKGQFTGLAVDLQEAIQPYGHHGTYSVGPITASPPAVSVVR